MAIELIHGKDSVIALPGRTAPVVSPLDNVHIYFDINTNQLLASLDGGPWTPFSFGGGAGLTLQGAYDNGASIAIGAGGPVAITKGAADAVDALDITVSAGTGAAISRTGFDVWVGTAAPAVSAAGTARMYFDSGTNRLRVSENGGAYVDIGSGGAGTLAATLALGNTTGAIPIVINSALSGITSDPMVTISIQSGGALAGSNAGNVSIVGGPGDALGGDGGSVGLSAGAGGSSATSNPGSAIVQGGLNSPAGTSSGGGAARLRGGGNQANARSAGLVEVLAGSDTSVAGGVGGKTYIRGGQSTNGTGGDVEIRAGGGGVSAGQIVVGDLNTSLLTLGAGGQHWAVNTSGHLYTYGSDNTRDIGAAGTTRPRRVYVGTEVVVGNSVTISTNAVTGNGTTTVQSGGAGGWLNLFAANNAGGVGGKIVITAGNGLAGAGGDIEVDCGVGSGANNGGALHLRGGIAGPTGAGGAASLDGGPSVGGAGGQASLNGGTGATFGGAAYISGGGGQSGGQINIVAGNGTTGNGGNVIISAGSSGSGSKGEIWIGQLNTKEVYIAQQPNGTDVLLGTSVAGGGTTYLSGLTMYVRSGTSNDIFFNARNSGNIPLNQSGSTTLSGFTATSIIGALNELKSGSGLNTYTNGSGSPLAQGEVVYQTAVASTVDRADATSGAGGGLARNGFGFVQPAAGIGIGATGAIETSGRTQALLMTGLVGVTAGMEVYVSNTTAGQVTTDVTPAVFVPGSGDVKRSIGFITNIQGYTGAAAALVEIQIVHGPVVVV